VSDFPENQTDKKPRWRERLIVFILTSCWIVLAGRLVQLQRETQAEFSDLAKRQQSFVEILPARPGEIIDRNGHVLATSVAVQSLWVNPKQIKNRDAFASKIAPALGLESSEILNRLNQYKNRDFLWLGRRLDEKIVQRVEQLKLPPELLGFRQEFIRRYPQGKLAAHVLGLRGIDGTGQGGLEQSFDKILRGSPGQRILIRDSRGKVLEVQNPSSTKAQHGQTIVLTIDAIQQLFVERELDKLMAKWKPKSAGIILVDPQTGEILAMASRPAFDPNNPINVPEHAWKNINIASSFEPGSTFKPIIVADALRKKLIQKGDVFHCGWGKYKMGPRLLHDHHPYGKLSVKNILVKSSNIGMAKIGEKLTNKGLYNAAVRFGFGRLTGSGLPGEIPARLRPLKKWNIYSTGSIPMGQELAVTPLQLIMAHAALANGGTLISPQLVSAIGAPKSFNRPSPSTKQISRRVISKTVDRPIADWLVQDVMTDVVKRGTGKKARLDEYEVFGKTGTAQKFDPSTGKYSSSRHVSSFIGGAPAKNPRVIVLVVVDEPTVGTTHYGGTVAAPTAARVIQQSLKHLQVSPEPRTASRE
jgi:cell division protein FtsI (penicillin-binding protein 3)